MNFIKRVIRYIPLGRTTEERGKVLTIVTIVLLVAFHFTKEHMSTEARQAIPHVGFALAILGMMLLSRGAGEKS